MSPAYAAAQIPSSNPVTWAYPPPSNLSTAPSQSSVWQHPLPNDLVFSTDYQTGSESATEQTNVTPRATSVPFQLPTPITQSNSNTLGAVGLNWNVDLQPAMHSYQTYPSPHSDVSGPSNTSNLSVQAGVLFSPPNPLMSSPHMAESPSSHHSSIKSTEPTRNAEGILFCNYTECARDPPLFARLCEWT